MLTWGRVVKFPPMSLNQEWRSVTCVVSGLKKENIYTMILVDNIDNINTDIAKTFCPPSAGHQGGSTGAAKRLLHISWLEHNAPSSELRWKFLNCVEKNPYSRCWSPCPGWACAWWAWRNLWRRCRCWCWDACRPSQWTERSSGQKRKSWESQREEGWTQFSGSSLFLRVIENTALDRVRCIRDKSLTDNLDSIIYRVATDVLEYTLKYTFGKRILDKTRVQEKPWLAWWNLNCFLHTQRKPEGEKKNFDTKNQKYSEESVEPRKISKNH